MCVKGGCVCKGWTAVAGVQNVRVCVKGGCARVCVNDGCARVCEFGPTVKRMHIRVWVQNLFPPFGQFGQFCFERVVMIATIVLPYDDPMMTL